MAKIKRLVTFGCSLTYGHGLADCYQPNGKEGPHPSVQAWPFLVARHYGIAIDNQGIPGGSNKQIFNTLRNYDFQKGDCVVVLWSKINRSCTLYPDYVDKFGPWLNSTRSKTWLKHIFSDYDSTIELLNYDEHTRLYLNSKKIKNCSYFTDHYMSFPQEDKKMFFKDYFDFARDGKHPGAETQRLFAKKVIEDDTGPTAWFA